MIELNQNHILIGLGRTGGQVIKAFQTRLNNDFSFEESLQFPIGFLHIDTADNLIFPSEHSAFLQLKEITNANSRREKRRCFANKVADYRDALEMLHIKLKACSGTRTTSLYIIAGLEDPLVSATLIDTITQARMMPLFYEAARPGGHGGHWAENSINAYLGLPTTPNAATYATIAELNAMLLDEWRPLDVSRSSSNERIHYPYILELANGLIVFENPAINGDVAKVSDFLYGTVFLPPIEEAYSFKMNTDLTHVMEPLEFGPHGKACRIKNIATFGTIRIRVNFDHFIQERDNSEHIPQHAMDLVANESHSAEKLMVFARETLQQCPLMASFNMEEVSRGIRYNYEPVVGSNILRKNIIVLLPAPSPQHERIAEQMKEAFRNACPPGVHCRVCYHNLPQGEINILNWAGAFPFRCLKSVKLHKEGYDSLSPEQKKSLYLEDVDIEFPPLFVPPEKPREQLQTEYMPHLILAYAMGVIKFGDIMDGTGRKAFGIVERDEDLGLETLKPLASKFTGIGESPRFDEGLCEDLKKMVQNQLPTFSGCKQDLRLRIMDLLNNVILPETGGNPASKTFLTYCHYAKTASDMLE